MQDETPNDDERKIILNALKQLDSESNEYSEYSSDAGRRSKLL